MNVEPDVFRYMSILFAVAGAVEFLLGVWLLSRADNNNKFAGSLMQGAGPGFMVAAAIFYFAPGHDWSLIAGIGCASAGSTIGALRAMRFVKARGETLR